MKIELIIEKGEGEFYGRVNGGDDLITTVADTIPEVVNSMKELIADHKKHEGKKSKFWGGVDLKTLEFDLRYDLQALFVEFDELNISAVARSAGMNETLVRQYASGKKFPSEEQAKRIQVALVDLGKRLQKVKVFVA